MAAVAAAAFMLSVGSASAQQATELTEEIVVASALGERALDQLGEAAERRQQAEGIRARTWQNPRLSYEHEQLFDAEAEDTIVLQQVLRLSGRYGRMADAARLLAESERLTTHARRFAHATAIRTEFYRLLEAQRRIAIFEEWLAVMAQVDDELRRRVEAGESAPYERLRLQKEVADVEAAAARERAELAARKVHLARLLDMPLERAADIRATGNLMPAAPPDDAALAAAVSRRPDVAAADARIRAAGVLDEAADSWWVPEPQLEAGYKTAGRAEVRHHGFVAGLSITLPFVGQAKAQREEAEAMRLEAEGEKEFTVHHVTAEVLGLARRIRVLIDAAAAYERDGVATATKVVETAQLAYSAGELGILELIDGYRGLVQSQLSVLDIAVEARASEIELWREIATTNLEGEQ